VVVDSELPLPLSLRRPSPPPRTSASRPSRGTPTAPAGISRRPSAPSDYRRSSPKSFGVHSRTLGHHGVLFLDQLTEFRLDAVEARSARAILGRTPPPRGRASKPVGIRRRTGGKAWRGRGIESLGGPMEASRPPGGADLHPIEAGRLAGPRTVGSLLSFAPIRGMGCRRVGSGYPLPPIGLPRTDVLLERDRTPQVSWPCLR
jgi:hypothetical protein